MKDFHVNPGFAMQFLLLVYTDPQLMAELPEPQFDAHMRGCLQHADELQKQGLLLGFQQLEPTTTAKSVRVRSGRTQILDGPFAETKEMLAGFNLIEADSMAHALSLAQEFPWTQFGCIEVRPVRNVAAVRQRVGAQAQAQAQVQAQAPTQEQKQEAKPTGCALP